MKRIDFSSGGGLSAAFNFNHLAYAQDYCAMMARITALLRTDTGALYFELLTFLGERIERSENRIAPVHAKVLIGAEQVETPTIPILLAKPFKLDYLTGLLADVNTDVTIGRTDTCPAALYIREQGYPVQMNRIATFIDELIGPNRRLRASPPQGEKPKRKPQM